MKKVRIEKWMIDPLPILTFTFSSPRSLLKRDQGLGFWTVVGALGSWGVSGMDGRIRCTPIVPPATLASNQCQGFSPLSNLFQPSG